MGKTEFLEFIFINEVGKNRNNYNVRCEDQLIN